MRLGLPTFCVYLLRETPRRLIPESHQTAERPPGGQRCGCQIHSEVIHLGCSDRRTTIHCRTSGHRPLWLLPCRAVKRELRASIAAQRETQCSADFLHTFLTELCDQAAQFPLVHRNRVVQVYRASGAGPAVPCLAARTGTSECRPWSVFGPRRLRFPRDTLGLARTVRQVTRPITLLPLPRLKTL
jgi:hypothetical protein